VVTAQSPTPHGGQQRNVKICMGNSTTSSPAQWKKAQQQALHGEKQHNKTVHAGQERIVKICTGNSTTSKSA
jgi:predicted SnoaL-like aldol condensation-catalyzing enzyme